MEAEIIVPILSITAIMIVMITIGFLAITTIIDNLLFIGIIIGFILTWYGEKT